MANIEIFKQKKARILTPAEKITDHAPYNPTLSRPFKYNRAALAAAVREVNPDRLREKSEAFNRYRLTGVLYYPELVANSCNGSAKPSILSKKTPPTAWVPPCVFSFITFKCATGHLIQKAMFCGREWCPTCGAKGSTIHARRISRWNPKAAVMNVIGYAVVTVPEKVRHCFRTKFDLNNLRTYIRRKFKREKFLSRGRGLIRFHWAGDCKVCKGKKCKSCNHTGADSLYHPHLNVLFDAAGYLSKEKFEKEFTRMRAELSNWFTAYTGTDCRGLGNINYRFSNREGKKKHWLKYVTRATWRFYDREVCTMIKHFHTSTTFGAWKDVTARSPEEAVESKCCPVCIKDTGALEILKKVNVLTRQDFTFLNKVELLPGVFYCAPG